MRRFWTANSLSGGKYKQSYIMFSENVFAKKRHFQHNSCNPCVLNHFRGVFSYENNTIYVLNLRGTVWIYQDWLGQFECKEFFLRVCVYTFKSFTFPRKTRRNMPTIFAAVSESYEIFECFLKVSKNCRHFLKFNKNFVRNTDVSRHHGCVFGENSNSFQIVKNSIVSNSFSIYL